MTARIWLAGCALLALGACSDVQPATSGPDEGLLKEVPEAVLALAASNQDLTAIRIDPVDRCFTYRYRGPVETTFLPLRTDEGRPICIRPAEEVAEAATTDE